MFTHPFFHDRRNAAVIIGLGAIVGLLALWLVFKAIKPVVKSVCTYVIESDDSKRLGREGRLVAIEAETIKFSTMTRRINTVGKLNANAIVTIKSEINGRIREILFTEGSSVSKDQPVIQFEDADIQAELKQAEAEFTRASADYERFSKLHEQKIGSSKDYDRAKSEFQMTEAKVDAARARLAKTVIRAPFEGNVGLISFSPGAFMQVNQELVTIVDSSPIKVEFKVPERFANDIGVGQQAEIKIDGFKDQSFMATVEAVDAKVEAESHSIAAKASIPNEKGLLKAGLFANVSLIIGEKGDTLNVAESAVDRDGEIEFVWVVEKGKAARRRVLTGVREGGRIEVIAGLRANQIVVTAGQIKLADGLRVKITNMETEAASEAEDAPSKDGNPATQAKADKPEAPTKAEDAQTTKAPTQGADAKPEAAQAPETKPAAADTSPQNKEEKPQDASPNQEAKPEAAPTGNTPQEAKPNT
jgi:membrane fusion protein (multidrug efflux system)